MSASGSIVQLSFDLSCLAPFLGDLFTDAILLVKSFKLVGEFFDSMVVNHSLLSQNNLFPLNSEACMVLDIQKGAGWHLPKNFAKNKLDSVEHSIGFIKVMREPELLNCLEMIQPSLMNSQNLTF